MVETAVVFSGGDPPDPSVVEHLPTGALVVAADSGLDHAHVLGVPVDLVVGDLDSASAEALETARGDGVPVEEHPADKDATDLHLALDAAVARGAGHLIVVGGHGGRIDHFFGNLLVVAAPEYAGCTVDLFTGTTRLHVVHGGQERTLPASVGELCSLLPVHGGAEAVRATGVRWPLAGEDLPAGTSRGLSNEVEGTEITVGLAKGTLVVVFP